MTTQAPAGLTVGQHRRPTPILLMARRDLFVEGIIRILESLGDELQVDCVAPDRPCASHFTGRHPDLLLLQEKSRPEPFDRFVRELVEGFPGMRLLVFGQSMTDDDLYRVVRAGAHGYINERMNGKHMLDAISAVLQGEYWIERHVLQRFIAGHSLADDVYCRVKTLNGRLTRRESEVLELVMQGMTTGEIAERVFLSHQGVKAHLTTLFRKFGVRNRPQLILKALDEVCPVENLTGLMRQGLHSARTAGN